MQTILLVDKLPADGPELLLLLFIILYYYILYLFIRTSSFPLSFGLCPYMTDDNKDQLKGKDLLVAYYDVDYDKNPKGSNYWRNR